MKNKIKNFEIYYRDIKIWLCKWNVRVNGTLCKCTC
jgi:hypothetical protein